jgi:hypothetical protein
MRIPLNNLKHQTLRLIFQLCAVAFVVPLNALATPILALKEAQNCQGCHKPGRAQRPFLERRCTLDCQGCHIDPSGAGPRNAWGKYYSQAELNTAKFMNPEDPLTDTTRFDVHYDGRIITRYFEDELRRFPMSNELSARVRPFVNYLHLTYQAVLFGRIGDQSIRATRDDSRRFREKYSIMIDQLPLNLYARAYRGQPMYGVRRPNHTLWIRERIGLDQFAFTEAVEFGGTPNVPFLRGSIMQGDPYANQEDRQKGSSFHGGFRGVTMAWHINGSAWQTESEKAKIKMSALGVGLKPWKFILMAERNWRRVEENETPTNAAEFESRAIRLHPSSEITEYSAAFDVYRGILAGFVMEELHDARSDSLRRSVFADFHLIPWLQFEIWRRFETGTRKAADTLSVLHAYFDF